MESFYITRVGVNTFCCSFFRSWFPKAAFNSTLLRSQCLMKCHYSRPLLPGNFHQPDTLIGRVWVGNFFFFFFTSNLEVRDFFFPKKMTEWSLNSRPKHQVRFPTLSPAVPRPRLTYSLWGAKATLQSSLSWRQSSWLSFHSLPLICSL